MYSIIVCVCGGGDWPSRFTKFLPKSLKSISKYVNLNYFRVKYRKDHKNCQHAATLQLLGADDFVLFLWLYSPRRAFLSFALHIHSAHVFSVCKSSPESFHFHSPKASINVGLGSPYFSSDEAFLSTSGPFSSDV